MAASSPSCEHLGSEVVAQGVWDLSSLTRDQNFVPCIGMGLSTEPPLTILSRLITNSFPLLPSSSKIQFPSS